MNTRKCEGPLMLKIEFCIQRYNTALVETTVYPSGSALNWAWKARADRWLRRARRLSMLRDLGVAA